MRNKISQIINSVAPISDKSIDKIINLVEYISLEKGELISLVGKKNNMEYFITDGICKSYLTTSEGEDITISLFMSNSVISPSTTRNKNGRSMINIQALTQVEIAALNATDFEKLMIEDLEIRDFGNSVLRNKLMAKVHKEIALASLKGMDRLHLLRKNFPNIENLIPHANIASYLGLTTISLSRLRTKS